MMIVSYGEIKYKRMRNDEVEKRKKERTEKRETYQSNAKSNKKKARLHTSATTEIEKNLTRVISNQKF